MLKSMFGVPLSDLHGKCLSRLEFQFAHPKQVYMVSRHIPDRTQRWRGVPFLHYNNKKCFIKFWAINKTEVQKIDIEVKVEVSGWLWLDQRPYFCPNQDPEALLLDFKYYQKLSKYQVLLFWGIFQLSKLHFDDLGPGI